MKVIFTFNQIHNLCTKINLLFAPAFLLIFQSQLFYLLVASNFFNTSFDIGPCTLPTFSFSTPIKWTCLSVNEILVCFIGEHFSSSWILLRVLVSFSSGSFSVRCFIFDFDGIETMSAWLLLWLSCKELALWMYGSESSVFYFSSYTYSILSMRGMFFKVLFFLTGIKTTPSTFPSSSGH